MEWKPFLFQNLTFFFSPLFLETHWTSVASCFSIFTCCCSAFWGPATCTISSPPPPHPPPPSPPPPAPSPSSPGASHSPQLWVWSTSYLHLKGEVIRVHLQDHLTKTKAAVSSSSDDRELTLHLRPIDVFSCKRFYKAYSSKYPAIKYFGYLSSVLLLLWNMIVPIARIMTRGTNMKLNQIHTKYP